MDPEEYASIYRLEQTHWWYVGMRRIALMLLEAYLPGKHGLKVLDAGCGTGGMMLALERYGQVFAEMVQHIKRSDQVEDGAPKGQMDY